VNRNDGGLQPALSAQRWNRRDHSDRIDVEPAPVLRSALATSTEIVRWPLRGLGALALPPSRKIGFTRRLPRRDAKRATQARIQVRFFIIFTSAGPQGPGRSFLPLDGELFYALFLNGYHSICGTWYATKEKYVVNGQGLFHAYIATWNVNSIRQPGRAPPDWLKECSPDIVCLQEIKCIDEAFPRTGDRKRSATNVVTHGQKDL